MSILDEYKLDAPSQGTGGVNAPSQPDMGQKFESLFEHEQSANPDAGRNPQEGFEGVAQEAGNSEGPQSLYDNTVDKISRFGGGLGKGVERVGSNLEAAVIAFDESLGIDSIYSSRRWKKERKQLDQEITKLGDAGSYGATAGEIGASVVPVVGASLLGSPFAGAAVAGGISGADQFGRLSAQNIQAGKSASENIDANINAGLRTGAIDTGLAMLGGKLLRDGAKFTKTVGVSGTEGGASAAQAQMNENIATGRPLMENVATAGAFGVGIGGVLGGASKALEIPWGKRSTEEAAVLSKAQKAVKKPGPKGNISEEFQTNAMERANLKQNSDELIEQYAKVGDFDEVENLINKQVKGLNPQAADTAWAHVARFLGDSDIETTRAIGLAKLADGEGFGPRLGITEKEGLADRVKIAKAESGFMDITNKTATKAEHEAQIHEKGNNLIHKKLIPTFEENNDFARQLEIQLKQSGTDKEIELIGLLKEDLKTLHNIAKNSASQTGDQSMAVARRASRDIMINAHKLGVADKLKSLTGPGRLDPLTDVMIVDGTAAALRSEYKEFRYGTDQTAAAKVKTGPTVTQMGKSVAAPVAGFALGGVPGAVVGTIGGSAFKANRRRSLASAKKKGADSLQATKELAEMTARRTPSMADNVNKSLDDVQGTNTVFGTKTAADNAVDTTAQVAKDHGTEAGAVSAEATLNDVGIVTKDPSTTVDPATESTATLDAIIEGATVYDGAPVGATEPGMGPNTPVAQAAPVEAVDPISGTVSPLPESARQIKEAEMKVDQLEKVVEDSQEQLQKANESLESTVAEVSMLPAESPEIPMANKAVELAEQRVVENERIAREDAMRLEQAKQDVAALAASPDPVVPNIVDEAPVEAPVSFEGQTVVDSEGVPVSDDTIVNKKGERLIPDTIKAEEPVVDSPVVEETPTPVVDEVQSEPLPRKPDPVVKEEETIQDIVDEIIEDKPATTLIPDAIKTDEPVVKTEEPVVDKVVEEKPEPKSEEKPKSKPLKPAKPTLTKVEDKSVVEVKKKPVPFKDSDGRREAFNSIDRNSVMKSFAEGDVVGNYKRKNGLTNEDMDALVQEAMDSITTRENPTPTGKQLGQAWKDIRAEEIEVGKAKLQAEADKIAEAGKKAADDLAAEKAATKAAEDADITKTKNELITKTNPKRFAEVMNRRGVSDSVVNEALDDLNLSKDSLDDKQYKDLMRRVNTLQAKEANDVIKQANKAERDIKSANAAKAAEDRRVEADRKREEAKNASKEEKAEKQRQADAAEEAAVKAETTQARTQVEYIKKTLDRLGLKKNSKDPAKIELRNKLQSDIKAIVASTGLKMNNQYLDGFKSAVPMNQKQFGKSVIDIESKVNKGLDDIAATHKAEHDRLQDALSKSDTVQTVEQASFLQSRMDRAKEASKKAEENRKELEATNKAEEKAASEALAAKKQLAEVEARELNQKAVDGQQKRISKAISERLGDEGKPLVDDYFRFRDRPFESDNQVYNEIVNNAEAKAKVNNAAEDAMIAKAVSAQTKSIEDVLSGVNPEGLAEAINTLNTKVEDLAKAGDSLEAESFVKAIDKAITNLKEKGHKPPRGADDIAGGYSAFLKEHQKANINKEKYPNNPELWLDGDFRNEIRKGLGRSDNTSNIGSYGTALEMLVYGSRLENVRVQGDKGQPKYIDISKMLTTGSEQKQRMKDVDDGYNRHIDQVPTQVVTPADVAPAQTFTKAEEADVNAINAADDAELDKQASDIADAIKKARESKAKKETEAKAKAEAKKKSTQDEATKKMLEEAQAKADKNGKKPVKKGATLTPAQKKAKSKAEAAKKAKAEAIALEDAKKEADMAARVELNNQLNDKMDSWKSNEDFVSKVEVIFDKVYKEANSDKYPGGAVSRESATDAQVKDKGLFKYNLTKTNKDGKSAIAEELNEVRSKIRQKDPIQGNLTKLNIDVLNALGVDLDAVSEAYIKTITENTKAKSKRKGALTDADNLLSDSLDDFDAPVVDAEATGATADDVSGDVGISKDLGDSGPTRDSGRKTEDSIIDDKVNRMLNTVPRKVMSEAQVDRLQKSLEDNNADDALKVWKAFSRKTNARADDWNKLVENREGFTFDDMETLGYSGEL